MSETAKPRVYGFCDAGCRRETVLREDFLRSASLYEIYPNSDGVWYLELKKQYKIFAPKDENGAFSFELYVHYIIDKHYIKTSTNDEYADWFVFRLLDYKWIAGTGLKIVYEIEGNRYIEIIADGDAVEYVALSGATQVFLYNDDATVYARDGADGKDGTSGISGTYYTIAIPAATDTDLKGWTATASGYELLIGDVSWMTEDLFIELKCENAAVFTEHSLMLHQDNGFLDFSIDSLPETASTLYIVVPKMVHGGLLNGGDA